MLSGYDLVIDSLGGQNLEKSLTVLKPGGLAIGVAGPPDAGFARQLGAPSILGVVMTLLSRKIRKQAKALDVRYEFFFMQASGSQLRELGALYDAGVLRPVIDRTFPFEQTTEAMAYVEQGRTKAGKVVVTMASSSRCRVVRGLTTRRTYRLRGSTADQAFANLQYVPQTHNIKLNASAPAPVDAAAGLPSPDPHLQEAVLTELGQNADQVPGCH